MRELGGWEVNKYTNLPFRRIYKNKVKLCAGDHSLGQDARVLRAFAFMVNGRVMLGVVITPIFGPWRPEKPELALRLTAA